MQLRFETKQNKTVYCKQKQLQSMSPSCCLQNTAPHEPFNVEILKQITSLVRPSSVPYLLYSLFALFLSLFICKIEWRRGWTN